MCAFTETHTESPLEDCKSTHCRGQTVPKVCDLTWQQFGKPWKGRSFSMSLQRAVTMQLGTEVSVVPSSCGSEPLREEGVGGGEIRALHFKLILI